MKKSVLGILAVVCLTGGVFGADLEAAVVDALPGESTGEIDLVVNGGVSPYVYSWTGPGGFTSSDEDLFDLAPGTYTVTVTDLYCGTATLNVVVDEVDNSSIDEEKEVFELSVFPNPTSGMVYLTSNTALDVVVFNIVGERVFSAQNITQFDLTGNPVGIYMIQVSSDYGVVTRKITLI